MLDWRLMNDEGRINPDLWRLRRQMKASVGTCRCRGSLVALNSPAAGPGRLAFYEYECERCGHEGAVPVGKVLRHPVPAA